MTVPTTLPTSLRPLRALLPVLLLALPVPGPLPGLLPGPVRLVAPPPGADSARTTPAAPRGPTSAVPAGQGVWPLQPRPPVVRGFDPPDAPWGRGHRGVDLLGRPGQPVHASLGGRITFAAVLAGRGVVVVDHGPVRTTYEPVTASVRVGQAVGKGAVIGTLSSTGSHCAPRACLHWGLLSGETYLDPLVLVGGLPVRLLPLGGPG